MSGWFSISISSPGVACQTGSVDFTVPFFSNLQTFELVRWRLAPINFFAEQLNCTMVVEEGGGGTSSLGLKLEVGEEKHCSMYKVLNNRRLPVMRKIEVEEVPEELLLVVVRHSWIQG